MELPMRIAGKPFGVNNVIRCVDADMEVFFYGFHGQHFVISTHIYCIK